MSYPSDITYVQVTGTWYDAYKQPAVPPTGMGYPASRVVITPRVATRWADYSTSQAIMPQRQTLQLDSTGSVSGQVIPVDCPALAGVVGMSYVVAVLLWDSTGAQIAPYSFVITPTTGSSPIVFSSPQYAVLGNSVGQPAM